MTMGSQDIIEEEEEEEEDGTNKSDDDSVVEEPMEDASKPDNGGDEKNKQQRASERWKRASDPTNNRSQLHKSHSDGDKDGEGEEKEDVTRPELHRRYTGDGMMTDTRRSLGGRGGRGGPPPTTRRPIPRSLSGDATPGELQLRGSMMMKNSRAMSTRDFGRPSLAGASGGAMGRGPGRGLTRGGLAGPAATPMAAKSMSTRFLDRMASTRALFNLDYDSNQPDPHIIIYMGREIKGDDLFDEDWIQDALDEQSGLKAMGSSFQQQQQQKQKPQRVSLNNRRTSGGTQMADDSSNNNNNSIRDREPEKNEDNDDDSASEVEEPMEDESMNDASRTSQTGGGRGGMDSSSRRRSIMRQQRPRRAKSSDPAINPLQRQQADTATAAAGGGPRRQLPGRSKTFDGTKTSEILPRRRKPKNRSDLSFANNNNNNNKERHKDDLLKAFQEFLAKGGSVLAAGRLDNNFLLTQTEFPAYLEPRRQVRPTTKKKWEQFKKLEYTPQDINDVLFEDDDTFQRLKRVLTKKGAITNGVLQQRLHIFLKKAKDRQSKLLAKRKEEDAENAEDDDDDADANTNNLQSAQADWVAMSMMDMFAQSMRKLTAADTNATNEPPTANTGIATSNATPPPPGAPPAFQRRALPRQQLMMSKVKESRMQAAKKSTKLLMISVEEDEEEEEEATERDPSVLDHSKASTGSNGVAKDSLLGKAPSRTLPTKKTERGFSSATTEPPVANKSKLGAWPERSANVVVPAPPGDGKLSKTTDLEMELAVLMLQPKCLDDELTGSQRPMKLDLSQTFQQPPELLIRCIDDDSKRGEKPLQLDLTGEKIGKLLVEPKYSDHSDDESLLFDKSGKADSSSRKSSRGSGSRIRNSIRASIRMSSSSNGSGSGRRDRPRRAPRRQPSHDGHKSGDSDDSGTRRSDRRRTSRSTDSGAARRDRNTLHKEDPPPLQIKCLDNTPPANGSSTSRSRTPPPPGLLVGWNH